MNGGRGDDLYLVDNPGDLVSEAASAGTDTVQTTISYTLGATIENLALMGTANLDGTGNALANTITGNAGNNRLDGAGGKDRMIGGQGNDTYVVDHPDDVVVEDAGGGTDTVETSAAYKLGANIEILTLTGEANINGTGNELANRLQGNAGANVLDGGAGTDSFAGGLGDDTYVLDTEAELANITEAAAAGSDTLKIAYTNASKTPLTISLAGQLANVENVILAGKGAFDVVGNAGDNFITGNASSNSMAGGAGNDTYVVDNLGDTVAEKANEGFDTVRASVSFALGDNIEALVLLGAATDGVGNAQGNAITGTDGANLLDGGLGADTLAGGKGNDTYVVDDKGDQVIEAAGAGTDLIRTFISYTLDANLENLTLVGKDSINATGNDVANVLTGNEGSNRLDGMAGADSMAGGKGDDTYVVDNSGDVVTEAASSGTDTVESGVDFTLGENIENLLLIGTALNGTGNDLGNTLRGNALDNILDGKKGADTLIGGAGNDTYLVDHLGDVATEEAGAGIDQVLSAVSYQLGANIENLTLTGKSNINGTGNAGDNLLTGNAGNNVLNGNGGRDTLVGGAGNDTYEVGNLEVTIVEEAATGGGVDTVKSALSYSLAGTAGLENITLTGSALVATGNEQANALAGNAASNTLEGNGGNDTLSGGDGDDLLLGGGGNDVLNGDSGDDSLDGGEGVDILKGGAGDDTYAVDLLFSASKASLQDTITETSNAGTDTVVLRGSSTLPIGAALTIGANIENMDASLTGATAINITGNGLNNVITGNEAANLLSGGAGKDTLIGGAGADTLAGGTGADTFVLDLLAGVDTVTDFTAGVDHIALAKTAFGTLFMDGRLKAGVFGLGSAASTDTMRLFYDAKGGCLYYDQDGNGTAAAVQLAIIGSKTHPTLTEQDFAVL